jgi:polyhydroxybutyrate depolymerase
VPKPHAAGDVTITLRSGGMDRRLLLHVPPSYDGTSETPLVLNLHGFGSNGRQQALYSGFPAKADRDGFIVASPDGTGTPLRWNYPGLGGVDDVAFMRDLLDRLDADLCIDTGRVFIAGISNGAAFAQIVACAMPERIMAVAAVAALVYPQRCGTDAPIAVVGFQGTDDPCVPFGGGTSACGQRLQVPPIEESARNWARHDGCDIAPAEQRFSAHVRTIAYSRCKNETAVVLFVVEGGGHTWPGAFDVPRLGATTQEVNATDQIWDFFTAQGNLRAR